MSVAMLLGLDEPGAGLLEVAKVRWPTWQRHHAALRIADDVVDLKAATRRLERTRTNEIMLALARQGSPAGGNEAAATAVLVWLLLPGAALIAGRLRRSVPDLRTEADQLVAGQMWIEARSVREAGKDSTNYAATLLMNVERSIRRELGIHERSDKAHRKSIPMSYLDGSDFLARAVGEPALVLTPEIELGYLFDVAIRAGVITAVDAQLLLEVAHEADGLCSGTGRAVGLMSEAVSQAVAKRRGCSSRAVRRRTHTTVSKLRASHEDSIGRSA